MTVTLRLEVLAGFWPCFAISIEVFFQWPVIMLVTLFNWDNLRQMLCSLDYSSLAVGAFTWYSKVPSSMPSYAPVVAVSLTEQETLLALLQLIQL